MIQGRQHHRVKLENETLWEWGMNGDEIAPPRVVGNRTTQFAQMFLQPMHTSTIDVQCSFICMAQLHERFQGDSAIYRQSVHPSAAKILQSCNIRLCI